LNNHKDLEQLIAIDAKKRNPYILSKSLISNGFLLSKLDKFLPNSTFKPPRFDKADMSDIIIFFEISSEVASASLFRDWAGPLSPAGVENSIGL